MEEYYEACLCSIKRYTDDRGMDFSTIPLKLREEIVFRYYKNYYSYEMDDEFAAQAAISEVIADNGIVLDGFEAWNP